jgi:hypothetical protein
MVWRRPRSGHPDCRDQGLRAYLPEPARATGFFVESEDFLAVDCLASETGDFTRLFLKGSRGLMLVESRSSAKDGTPSIRSADSGSNMAVLELTQRTASKINRSKM